MRIKYFVVFAILLTVLFGFSGNTKALTIAELQVQVNALLQQLAQLQEQLKQAQNNDSQVKWCYNFTKNLRIGDTGKDVEALWTALNKEYPGDVLNISYDHEGMGQPNKFGEYTASAVSEFQEKYADEILKPNGLRKGNGYVGPATRKKLNAIYGCSKNEIIIPPFITCAQDVKQCSDGSYVSRTGANCEFAQCPVTTKLSITSVSPTSGQVGTMVSLIGNFPTWQGNGSNDKITYVVLFNDSWVAIKSVSMGGAQISFELPSTMPTICTGSGGICPSSPLSIIPGNYSVSVLNPQTGAESNKVNLTVVSSTQPSITVTSPNGGEVLKVGEMYNITWNTSQFFKNQYPKVTITLIAGSAGQAITTINTITTDNTGSYSWTIPNVSMTAYIQDYPAGPYTLKDVINQKLFKIQIEGYPHIGSPMASGPLDNSDNYFTIIPATVQPSVTVTSPNGGEVWKVGETYDIAWNAFGDVGNVNIIWIGYDSFGNITNSMILSPLSNGTGSMSTCNQGGTNDNNAGVPASQGKFSWTIPQCLSGNLSRSKIRVINSRNTYTSEVEVSDLSDNYFSIVMP